VARQSPAAKAAHKASTKVLVQQAPSKASNLLLCGKAVSDREGVARRSKYFCTSKSKYFCTSKASNLLLCGKAVSGREGGAQS
jgi:hypothetical protein